MISQRTLDGKLISLPDADINYGWGENIQLKADLPWSYAQQNGGSWSNGAGFANYGVKWRFVDEDDAGFDMSTYPQYAHNLPGSSLNAQFASGGGQFFLPIEIQSKVGEFELDGEVGRNFVQQGANQWEAGAAISHGCGKDIECLAEVHATYTEAMPGAAANTQTLINLGFNWKLNESMTLLFAAGREFGPQTPYQLRSLAYLGLQITR